MKSALYSKACGIARRVISSTTRSGVHTALRSLTYATEEQMLSRNEVSLEYFSRPHRLQFSGLLLLNSYREEGNAKLPPMIQLRALNEEQHRWVGTGDRFIRAVHERLLQRLRDRIGAWASACDPYSGLRELTYHADTPSHDEVLEHCNDAIAVTAHILEGHPGISVIEKSAKQFPAIPEAIAVRAVRAIKTILEEEQGRPTQTDIDTLCGRTTDGDLHYRAITRATGQACVIRNALGLIDAILYDAFQMDAIVNFTEDNVFEVAGEISDELGPVTTIALQPQQKELAVDKGDVVYVNLPSPTELVGPAMVAGYESNFQEGLGMTIRFNLRMLDEWMNPYARLSEDT